VRDKASGAVLTPKTPRTGARQCRSSSRPSTLAPELGPARAIGVFHRDARLGLVALACALALVSLLAFGLGLDARLAGKPAPPSTAPAPAQSTPAPTASPADPVAVSAGGAEGSAVERGLGLRAPGAVHRRASGRSCASSFGPGVSRPGLGRSDGSCRPRRNGCDSDSCGEGRCPRSGGLYGRRRPRRHMYL